MLHTPWMIRHKTCVVAKSRHALDQSLTNEGCVSLATARRVDMARGRPNLMMRGAHPCALYENPKHAETN